jgi:hypothetical protein
VSGKEMGKEHECVNVALILCTNVCKWKRDICWNYPRTVWGGIKENDGWDEFKYDIFDLL